MYFFHNKNVFFFAHKKKKKTKQEMMNINSTYRTNVTERIVDYIALHILAKSQVSAQ